MERFPSLILIAKPTSFWFRLSILYWGFQGRALETCRGGGVASEKNTPPFAIGAIRTDSPVKRSLVAATAAIMRRFVPTTTVHDQEQRQNVADAGTVSAATEDEQKPQNVVAAETATTSTVISTVEKVHGMYLLFSFLLHSYAFFSAVVRYIPQISGITIL